MRDVAREAMTWLLSEGGDRFDLSMDLVRVERAASHWKTLLPSLTLRRGGRQLWVCRSGIPFWIP